VSAKYCERARARKLMADLERQGHRITVDWTNHTQEDNEHLREYAIEDIKGATHAHVAIFIMERNHKYKGCWVEMGAALAKGRKVFIIGRAGDSCVFVNHPRVRIIPDMHTFLMFQLKDWYRDNPVVVSREYQPCLQSSASTANFQIPNIESCKTVNCQIIEDSYTERFSIIPSSNLQEGAENGK
jgi:hypothetical protein